MLLQPITLLFSTGTLQPSVYTLKWFTIYHGLITKILQVTYLHCHYFICRCLLFKQYKINKSICMFIKQLNPDPSRFVYLDALTDKIEI